jgi:hypothetical protein
MHVASPLADDARSKDAEPMLDFRHWPRVETGGAEGRLCCTSRPHRVWAIFDIAPLCLIDVSDTLLLPLLWRTGLVAC